MGRAPCCDKANVKKGPWSPDEDTKLKNYIQHYGTGGNWIALPQKAGLRRCGKSCRLRWLNYLRPDIKHGEFSFDEDNIICTLFATIGTRWSVMAAQLPGRTDNDIKNYWNTKLKKKFMNIISSSFPNYYNPQIKKLPNLHHLESLSYPLTNLYHSDHNTINMNPPLSSSPSTSPSSYLYNTNASFGYQDQTLSSSSPSVSDYNPVINVGSMENYQVKDGSTLMFGCVGDQASCSSNSNGSCHGCGMYDHHHHHNMGNLQNSNSYKGLDGNCEEGKGYYGDSSLDSSLEEFKQLISTDFCSSNINTNLNFIVDEIKIEENIMYY